MKRSKMLGRIEELERAVRELQARPLPALPPITVAPFTGPWWGLIPPVGAGMLTTNFPNTAGTNPTVVQSHNLQVTTGAM